MSIGGQNGTKPDAIIPVTSRLPASRLAAPVTDFKVDGQGQEPPVPNHFDSVHAGQVRAGLRIDQSQHDAQVGVE